MSSFPSSTRRQWLATGTASLLGLAVPSPAATSSAYAKRVLEKKPCGYWRLGEAAGTTVGDISGRGHNGLWHGAAKLGEKGMLDRDPDTAAILSSERTYVEIPNSPDFSQPTSGVGFSVEAWVRPDILDFAGESEDPYIHWLGKGEADRQEWAFRFYTRKSSRPNRMSAYAFNPGPGLGSGAYVEEEIKPGKWIHIVATFDPGDQSNPKAGVSIYKDGDLRGSPKDQPGALYSAYQVVPRHGTAPLRLGTRDLKNFLTGGLDEVAIYPRVLTAREIADSYRAGRAG